MSIGRRLNKCAQLVLDARSLVSLKLTLSFLCFCCTNSQGRGERSSDSTGDGVGGGVLQSSRSHPCNLAAPPRDTSHMVGGAQVLG